MLNRFTLPTLVLMFAAGALLIGSSATVVSADDSEMVYELRTYTCNPGKLPNLHARFKNHTMKLFEKHGMKNIMYWTPLDQEDTLIYIVAHESREAADKSWKAFVSDPEWKKAYQESIADGKLVKKVERKYMKATEYSP